MSKPQKPKTTFGLEIDEILAWAGPEHIPLNSNYSSLKIDEIVAWAGPEHFPLNVSARGCCTLLTAPEQLRDDLYSEGGRFTPTSVLAATLGVAPPRSAPRCL